MSVIISYTAVKQETLLTKSSLSIHIGYARAKVAHCLYKGMDVNKCIPWIYSVAMLDKDPKNMEGIPCLECNNLIRIRQQYYRRRSNHYTRIYCIPCADRLGMRQ